MSEPAPPPRVDADAVYDDFVSRREAGQTVDLENLCRTHPDIAAELRKRESARALLDQLFPGSLSGGREDAGDGASAAGDSPADSDGGTIAELLARLHSVGPRGSRYRIVNEIARGGMGIVLRVVDTELRRKLAMKVARAPGVVGDKVTPPSETRALDRFLQEAQITSQLDHPGVVPVYEIGIGEDGRVFFTMRYVRGQTLKEVFELVRSGAEGWSQLRAVNVLLRVCETMSYAHDRSTIHRDLKPSNIMVGRFGEVYVMDWGLARVVGRPDAHEPEAVAPDGDGDSRVETLREDERDATPDSPRLTVDGEVLGTPAYMAPEQAGGEHDKVGPRSDVYAVGAMLYHLIAGEMPYVPADERVSSHAVRLRVIAGPPRPLQTYGRRSPPALVAVCEKAMARQVDARYADMRELASDLRAYVEGRVVAAYETGSWAETKVWVRRNKALAGVLAGVIAAVLLGAVETWRRAGELRRIEEVRQAVGALRQFEREEGDPDFGRQLTSSATAWWCERVDVLLASRRLLHVEADRLRSRVQLEDAHRFGALSAFARREELDTKRDILRWRRRMLGDEPWPKVSDVQREVDKSFDGIEGAEGLRTINRIAFRYVRPDEPRVVGQEVFACALAERLTSWPEASLVLPTYLDTYAFALFRVGEFDRAIEVQRQAVDAEQELVRRAEADLGASNEVKTTRRSALAEREGNLAILTRFRDQWRNVEQQRRLTNDLAAEVAAMEREIEDEAWSLAMRADGSWYRDVTQTLRQLDQLERRRLLARETNEGASGTTVWQRAIDGVATAPQYGGRVRLTPQVGLLPLEANPESHLWEFLHVPSGLAPKRVNGKHQITPETGIVFVLLPGGRVPVQNGLERLPMHNVDLEPFFLSKYELTRHQWARLGGAWHRELMAESSGQSGVLGNVSWREATDRLAKTGGWLCLPTSAQWEFGCRAGTTTRFWSGDRIEDLWESAVVIGSPDFWGRGLSARRANPFGLHDTLGHVSEWCCDGPVDNAPARPGDGKRESNSNRRWHRGGSSNFAAEAPPGVALVETAYVPKLPGEQDFDNDGDRDTYHELPAETSGGEVGVRVSRPLLR